MEILESQEMKRRDTGTLLGAVVRGKAKSVLEYDREDLIS